MEGRPKSPPKKTKFASLGRRSPQLVLFTKAYSINGLMVSIRAPPKLKVSGNRNRHRNRVGKTPIY